MDFPEHTIEAYLDGELSLADQAVFETALSSNPDLAHTVEEHKQLRGLMQQYQTDHSQRAKISNIYHRIKEEDTSTVRRFSRFWPILLAAASLAFLVWIFWPRQTYKYSPSELFAASFLPAPAPQKMSGDQDSSQQILALGHSAYSQQAYAQAIAYYQQVLPNGLLRSESAFFLAQSYLATQQYEQAAAALQWVDHRKQEAAWYGALAALAQGDIQAARELLKPLAAHPAYDYHQEAKELLEKMEGR